MNKKPKPEINELNEKRLSHLDADEFATALRQSRNDGPVVTMLMPMERRGPDTRKNHIVFKNILRQAQEAVNGSTPRAAEISARLTALESFDAPTHGFWQDQDEGLAMVVEPEGRVTAYKVPFRLEPYVRVDHQPYLSPLLRLAAGRSYHVLSLDLDELRLFRASAWQLDEIELSDVPTSLAEAMKYDDPEESLQVRGTIQRIAAEPGSGTGRPVAAYHGHGVTNENVRNIKIRRYFEMVDKDLAKNFDTREVPLVLMGPPDLVGFYRNVNSYPHLQEETIAMNPSSLSPDELRERICTWVRGRDHDDRHKALATLSDNMGVGEGSADFAEVVKAASDGRVSTLFVKAGERRYGVNDRQADQVVVHETPEDGDTELVEATVLCAAEGGAAIHYLEGEEALPGGGCLAAIFRY